MAFTELLSETVGMVVTFLLITSAACLLPGVGAAVGERNSVDLTAATRCDYIVASLLQRANPTEQWTSPSLILFATSARNSLHKCKSNDGGANSHEAS
jgi:hypothetical protein